MSDSREVHCAMAGASALETSGIRVSPGSIRLQDVQDLPSQECNMRKHVHDSARL